MRIHLFLPLVFGSVLAAAAPQNLPSAEMSFLLLQRWCGEEAAALGFTQERLLAFLAARTGNLRAAQLPPWSDWLIELERTPNASLRAWALARRLESGDYRAYPAFQAALTEHVLGISKPGSGRDAKVITDPPRTLSLPMPGALRIDNGSRFWRSLRKTVQDTPDRKLDEGLYAVWCQGTHPDQRDLILDLAAHVQAGLSIRNPNSDPWNDPRFWIVMDWALAWGMQDDFAAIRQALPEGASRTGFDRVARSIAEVPGFFSSRPVPESMWIPPRPILAGSDVSKDAPVDFDFSQIRILKQPPAPPYPLEAKGRRLMTNLVLEIVVDPQGVPTSCRPTPGPWLGFFTPTGVAYAMQWRFRPAEHNGVPMQARFRLTMPFRLRN